MKIELPQVGESVTEGVIGKWLKQVGDRIEKYDLLVEVVTDKVNMEVPSPISGMLTNIVAEEGETVPMGAIIAEIDVEGEAPGAEPSVAAKAGAEVADIVDTTGVLLKDVAPMGPTGSGGPDMAPPPADGRAATESPRRQRHSPAVQRLADEHTIDLSEVTGTGMGGRVTRKDVLAYLEAGHARPPVAAAPAAGGDRADEERVPLTPVRRIIAENMVKSATQIPQAWTTVEVDVTNLVRLRESSKAEFQRREGSNLSYLPFVLKAVADSLREHPLLNSTWDESAIVLKRRINLGVATATPDGLVVPVIHDADSLSIVGLAKALDDLTNRARQGKLKLEDVQGGTFTVNNTGVLGSVVSQPLVNYPQAAIISTEAIVKRPVVIDDAIAIRSIMNLCLAFDHRVLDGAEAGAFVSSVKGRLEATDPEMAVV